ncbi:MAG: EF-P lysine aminoacylase EpmA [Halioglobus sp.]
MTWRPGASRQVLRARAALLADIRGFFSSRDILEVETPLLCTRGITDPAIEPLIVTAGTSLTEPRYLQTSPEYAMKRLLAAGSGAIYQFSKAFRDGEAGSRHNPEFTLLEWYQPGYDHHQLMAEVAELLIICLGDMPVQKTSYRDLFQDYLKIDPFTAPQAALEAIARSALDVGFSSGSRDLWLDLIMSHLIEPRLPKSGLYFVYDYPASQAALARIANENGVDVGQRFELYVNGMELANGYCELTDPAEQRSRFCSDNAQRRALGQPERPLDERLLAAMANGLPACSGVAMGVDRLLMIATGTADIRDVLAFDWAGS